MSVFRLESWVAQIGRWVDGLVCGRVGVDTLEWRRHRDFIAANLLAGSAALALMPLWLAFAGSVGRIETLALLGLVAPAPIALWVSRGGDLRLGQLMSTAIATCVLVWIALFSGGIASPSLYALAVVPMEAALTGRRDVMRIAFGLAVVALIAVAGVDFAGHLPVAVGEAGSGLKLLVPVFVVAYAGGLALRMETLHTVADEIARRRAMHYRIVAENISDIVTGHAENGDVVFVTPAVERILGVGPNALRGDGFFRMIHVADRPAYLTALSDAGRRGRAAAVEFRVQLDSADGRRRWAWLEMHCRPLDERDPLIGRACVVAVTRDVSAHKTQESDLLDAREAAEEASLAKTRFLANVSHELRTPLNAIIGFSEMLGAEIFGPLGDPRQREYVELIHESGAHLLQLVNGILDMSKIEAGSFDVVAEPFEVAPLIDGVRHMMALQLEERGLSLSVQVPDGMPEVVADRRACKQILINLLSNAIKFTDRAGRITLGARLEAGAVALFVRDTGIGIAEKDLQRLGTPFVQADTGYDRRHAGTGIGLSVVKGLARLHGGSLQIESRLGEGTCVTVRLPLDPELDEGRRPVGAGRVVDLKSVAETRPLEQKRA